MKKYAFSQIGILLLGGSLFSLPVQAAGDQALETFHSDELQKMVQDSMQKMIENTMDQMVQDSIRLQRLQPSMLIRLTDDAPSGLDKTINRNTTGSLPFGKHSPQSKAIQPDGKLG